VSIHEPTLATRVEDLLGETVRATSPAPGGDIGLSARVELANGRRCFAKRYPGAPAAMAAAEAAGLAWLRETRALLVPEALGFSQAGEALLILDWIESGRPAKDHDETLGRGLARLPLSGADGFGFPQDGYIGTLDQSNRARATWADFYREERLEPLARSASQRGLLDARVLGDLERLYGVLPERCGPPEPPARLHGDLWAGNRMVDESGTPVLIDPAAYGGHREVDLAMMRLFGGFGARVFSAYEESAPLAAGAEERVTLYQLYPLLVHVNLFGGHYAGQFSDALRRCL